jgi:hypothetical protein
MANPQNRDDTGRFLPGVSGNPAGRPKSLSRYIREKTNDGSEIADFFLGVFASKEKIEYENSKGEKVKRDPNLRERMEAAEWLADRGWGRPTQPISGDEDMPPVQFEQNWDLSKLSDEELMALERLVKKTT